MLYDISRMVEFLESELNSNKSNKRIIDEFPVGIRHANRIFKAFTGYTIYTYIQNRRMYLLGLRILDNGKKEKMYSLAKEYGYNLSTFVKAFVRFHGCTPSELKNDPNHLRTFLPLVITVTVSGGEVITPEIATIAPISLYVCNRHAKYDDTILQTRGIIESLRNDFANNDTDFFFDNDYYIISKNEHNKTDSFVYELGIEEKWSLPGIKEFHKTFSSDLWAIFKRPQNVKTVPELIEKIFKEWSINQTKYIISDDFLIERHFYDMQHKEDFEILLPVVQTNI